MARNYRAYRIVAAIVVGIVVLSLSTSTGQGRKGYEVEAQVYSVPVTQTDAARAINDHGQIVGYVQIRLPGGFDCPNGHNITGDKYGFRLAALFEQALHGVITAFRAECPNLDHACLKLNALSVDSL